MDNDEQLRRSQERDQARAKENAEQLADLRTLAQLYNLTIEKESRMIGLPVIVVKNEKGEDVSIGFPDGRQERPGGGAGLACATGRIKNVPMTFYGHGPWMFFINV